MIYWLILFNLLFAVYFIIRFKKRDFNILDLYFLSFWIGILWNFTVEYYYNQSYFENFMLWQTFVLIFINFITIWILRKTIFKHYTLNYLFKKFVKVKTATLLLIILIVTFLEIFILSKYGYIFRIAAGILEYQNFPYWLTSFIILIQPICYGLLGGYLINMGEPKKNKVLWFLFTICLLFIFFINILPYGRSEIFYFFSIIILGLFFIYKQNSSKIIIRNILVSILLIILIPLLFNYFQSIRENLFGSSQTKITTSQNSFAQLKYILHNTFGNTTSNQNTTLDSLRTRKSSITLIYQMVAIKTNLGNQPFSDKKILLQSIYNNIPRIFSNQNKNYFEGDFIVNQVWGFPSDLDEPSSIMMEFSTDFGLILGAILSALFVGLTIYILIKIGSIGKSFTKLFTFGAIIISVFYIETTTAAFIVLIRNALGVLIIEYVIYRIFFPKPKPIEINSKT